MDTKTKLSKAAGHWVLARMGKRVLRPGGKSLTLEMLRGLNITSDDNVIEFAPGMGFTAQLVNEKSPKSYTAIELNEEASKRLQKIFTGEHQQIIQANATAAPLEDGCADKLYGEAMLTMQGVEQKQAIINEASRLLRQGGLYGIHEIVLKHEDITMAERKAVHRSMGHDVKMSVLPITTSEWTELFEKAGFKVKEVSYKPMTFLEPKQMLEDEGFFRCLKIAFNMLIHPTARKRIMDMRRTFMENKDNLEAISIIAEKQ